MKYLLAFLCLVGCKTTDPVVKVNKDQNKITVFSSKEKGSALTHAADSRKISQTRIILEKKLDKEPKNVSHMLDLARIYLIQSDIKKARSTCQKALLLDLHNKAAAKLLAEIEVADNHLTKAEILIYRLKPDELKDAELYNLLGLISLKRKEIPAAFDLFQQGLKIEPDNAALMMNVGLIYLDHQQIELAATAFQRVLKSMPTHNDAKLHLAITYAYQGKDQVAEDLYTQVINSDSGNGFAAYNLSLVQYRRGALKESLANIDRALRSDDLSDVQEKKAQTHRVDVVAELKRQELEEEKKRDEDRKKKNPKTVAVKSATDPV